MAVVPEATVHPTESARPETWRRLAYRQKATVFVAEDDPEFRAALGDALAMSGVRPILFPTAQKLLRALDRHVPAAIVTDLIMPGLSGAQLLRAVRADERWRHLPVIVMTGSNDTALPLRLDAPIIYKPDTESLLQMIGTLVRGQRPRTAAA
jgi:CheY-like chemotaxis protein